MYIVNGGIVLILNILHQTIASIVVFLGFGVARIIGFALDGNPGEGVIQGIIIEFVLGLLAVFALFKYREKS